MGNRSLLHERIQARDLFIHRGNTYAEIGTLLNVHPDTVRSWSEQENWPTDRARVMTTSLAISRRYARLLERLLDDAEAKYNEDGHVSDFLLKRIDTCASILKKLDGQYDAHGMAITTMGHFLSFLRERGDRTLIETLDEPISAFYKYLRDSN